MKFIGITGGVGAGKSAILSYLAEKPKTKVMLADEIAHQLMEPGTDCYRRIVERFAGEDIFSEDLSEVENCKCVQSDLTEQENAGAFDDAVKDEKNVSTENTGGESRPFDRGKLAQIIFSNPIKREAMNAIVHPAVKDYVKKTFAEEQEAGELELLVLEAALLIEEKYDEICDELWYIYTSEENRRKRLVESRGYSHEKIDNIFKSQLTEQEFGKLTQITIDNNGNLRETYQQIENALRSDADE